VGRPAISYLHAGFPRTTMAAMYRIADVMVVTPLRDGMNLVAKEYVAAQNPENPGVLVLSMLAGAAAELDAALLVNPYDLDGVADAISRAASMPLPERRERWESMMRPITEFDIHAWCARFLERLARTTG